MPSDASISDGSDEGSSGTDYGSEEDNPKAPDTTEKSDVPTTTFPTAPPNLPPGMPPGMSAPPMGNWYMYPGQYGMMPAFASPAPGASVTPQAMMMTAPGMMAAQGGTAMTHPGMGVGGVPVPTSMTGGMGGVGGGFGAGALHLHSPMQTAQLEATRDSQGKKRRKKRKDKPKRPLSAYNIFFKQEREKILSSIPSKVKDGEKAKANNGVNEEVEKAKEDSTAQEGPSAKRIKVESNADQAKTDDTEDGDNKSSNDKEEDGSKVGEEESKLQPAPPGKKKIPHGKIGFESLAKTIGARWKELTPEQLEYYKAEAEKDSHRYASEMEEWNRRVESERQMESSVDCFGMPGLLESSARAEVQKIVSSVVGTSVSASAVAPDGKKRRGRRPRDSLLDPEALASWTAQCNAMAAPSGAYIGPGGTGYAMPSQMGVMPYMGYHMVPVMPGMMGTVPATSAATVDPSIQRGEGSSGKSGDKGEAI